MEAIDHIVNEINQQAKQARDELEKNRIEEIETKFLVDKLALEKEHKQRLEKQEQQLAKKLQQEKNRNHVEARQENLKQKQGYLEQILEEAYQKMCDWGIDEVRTFTLNALKKANISQGCLIIGGGMSPEIYSKEWLTQRRTEGIDLTLGEITANNTCGFAIESEGVRYNFFYHELLLEVKKMQGTQLMQRLFQ